MTLERLIRRIMRKGQIPGVCIVVVRPDQEDLILGFGYADKHKKIPVTPDTLFELASCSKAYTALAVLQLAEQKSIGLDDPVCTYLPGFYGRFLENQRTDITIRHLLHHTSGIPWQAISLVRPDAGKEALEKAARRLVGVELHSIPGKRFDYATVNYTILGAIVEKVTGIGFEDYMRENVLAPLGLHDTRVGVEDGLPLLTSGYKPGLFFPGRFRGPVFRGLNPSGYVISSGDDVCRWLKLQMGMIETPLFALIEKSQQPGRIPIYSQRLSYAYGMGWMIPQHRDEVNHTGLNPGFSSYIGFRPQARIGVAVLANSSSQYTLVLAEYVMAMFSGQRGRIIYFTPFFFNRYSTVAVFLLSLYLVWLVDKMLALGLAIDRGIRSFLPLSDERLGWLVMGGSMLFWVLLGIYIIPQKTMKLTWRMIKVWASRALPVAVWLFVAALVMTFGFFVLWLLFPILT